MSATDELRRLLEERNEEYDIRDNSGGLPSYVLVGWYFNLADRAYFYGYPDGRTKLITYRCTYDLTPEQAIAATLGDADLAAENAKLRELVRDLYLCSDETCTDCEYHDYSGKGFWCKRGVGWKKARMRELEVG